MAKKTENNKIEEKAKTQIEQRFELIRWDLKTKLFVGLCSFLFLTLVLFKIHGSSIPIWNQVANDGGSMKRGLVYGKPLAIRSDEWMVITPFILSQMENDFEVNNISLGFGKSALLMGLPTNTIFSYLKPSNWGYYFLDIERAYSWNWNIKTFPFLLVTFLMLMLILKNQFWLSVFGSIWILFSSSIVWWSINTELFLYAELSFISLIFVLYTNSKLKLAICGFILFISALNFILVLYPAYQVPLGYFYLFLFSAYFYESFSKELILNLKIFKIITLSIVVILVVSVVFYFLKETQETVTQMMNTVYPGKRDEVGGGFSFFRLYTDIFSPFMNETNFPQSWGNICELSGFLMFSPLILLYLITNFLITKKIDILLFLLSTFQLILLFWITIGFPSFLAKFTLFNMSPSYRSVFIFGYSSIILTLVFLARNQPLKIQDSTYIKLGTGIFLILVYAFIVVKLNQESLMFFDNSKVVFAILFLSTLSWLLLYSNYKKVFFVFFSISVLLFVLPNYAINPISKGLTPFYSNQIYKSVKDIVKSDPEAKWVVFGQFTYSNFLKAAGAKVISGVNYAPDIEKLRKLSNTPKSDSVYNRYAHISFYPLIDGKDSLNFTLLQSDAYAISIDPCMEKMKILGVKYVFFAYQPQAAEVRCMTKVSNSGLFIYKIND